MKKVFFMVIEEWYRRPFEIIVDFEGGQRAYFASHEQLADYDTSDLRILSTSYNKEGKFISYSAANFIGRQHRLSYTKQAAV